jgi:DHA3 family macrolide efflux protein-like MFS transporter
MSNAIRSIEARPPVSESILTSLKAFLIVWIGQVVSLLGSSMTGFALGVWVFQHTGSAASFALTLLFNMLPKALVAPFAGLLADRHNRRWIMILTDLGAGIATMIVVALYASGTLSTWHIYLLTALNACASAFQGPAFGAALTQLVPKEQFGRANGLQQLGDGLGQVIAPLLAGVLIGAFGLGSVLFFDLVTFLFAVAALLWVRFPDFRKIDGGRLESAKTWRSQMSQALDYLWARPGLLGLMLVFALVNFFVGVAEAVLTPMVLSFTTPEILGAIMTFGGLGMLVGSLLLTVFGGGQRKVYAVFGAYAVLGLAVCAAGLQPTALLVGAAAFLAFLCLPTVMGASQAILQAKVAPKIQGRVFGLRIFLNTLTFTFAYLIGGLLADSFFEPVMAVNSPLANSIGRLIGVGPGRGMGLMFILMGILAVLSALSAFAYPRIRRVEIELPDAIEA